MKKFMLLFMFTAVLSISVGCQPSLTTGVVVDNQNSASDDNALIRVWVLSEEEIQTPPTTRAEADGIENLVTYPFNTYQFPRVPGTYFVVASNETHYQGLSQDEAFEANEDFSLLEVEVADGFLEINVVNTDSPTFLPEITQ